MLNAPRVPRRAAASLLMLALLGAAGAVAAAPARRRHRARRADVGPRRGQRTVRLADDQGTGRDRRRDRQRGQPGRVRPGRLGHHRARPDRRAHRAGQPELGRARHLDGLADRRARARRRRQRHRGRGPGGQGALDPGRDRPARPRLLRLRARVGQPGAGRAGPGHHVRDQAPGERDQHVAGLRRAQHGGPDRPCRTRSITASSWSPRPATQATRPRSARPARPPTRSRRTTRAYSAWPR